MARDRHSFRRDDKRARHARPGRTGLHAFRAAATARPSANPPEPFLASYTAAFLLHGLTLGIATEVWKAGIWLTPFTLASA
ncbi:MAG: hypothetical protein R3C97_15705 [Geminicoccaceae bacterium]